MQPTSLTELVGQLLLAARDASNGRAAMSVLGGRQSRLRQALIALTGGRSLGEHETPGEATLQVLHGRVRLATLEAHWDLAEGDHLPLPAASHDLTADTDTVVLLTVLTDS